MALYTVRELAIKFKRSRETIKKNIYKLNLKNLGYAYKKKYAWVVTEKGKNMIRDRNKIPGKKKGDFFKAE